MMKMFAKKNFFFITITKKKEQYSIFKFKNDEKNEK